MLAPVLLAQLSLAIWLLKCQTMLVVNHQYPYGNNNVMGKSSI
jgi:hypothetical protein